MKSIPWICLLGIVCTGSNGETREFPKYFKFGVGSAAYQVEGAWNVSGKGESIWDHMTHTKPEIIKGKTNGDDAVKSYEYYMRDIKALQNLGVDFYRFSLSWSRLLPTGFVDKPNPDGIKYYNSLIDGLIVRNIHPSVTIYHWDLPQALQEIGGWVNPDMVEIFGNYSRFCYENFGDRVKTWITMNEPKEICSFGYATKLMPPALGKPELYYPCGHIVLKAHAKAYHIYDKEFRPEQKGRIGVTMSGSYYLPRVDNKDGREAARRRSEFEIGWFAHPIFWKDGNYPETIRNLAEERGENNDFVLPKFTKLEVKMIKGTSDFFGLNHYTTSQVASKSPNIDNPTLENDHRTWTWQNWWWTPSGSYWLKVTPWGFRGILNYLKDTYNNPEIIIFENGYSSYKNNLNDFDRVAYMEGYMNSMLDAILYDKVNVTGYSAWSLMDSFEWDSGYTATFGIHATNFSDPKRSLTPKESAKFYTKVIKSRKISRPEKQDFRSIFSLNFAEKVGLEVADRGTRWIQSHFRNIGK